ncbi:hypothetical protein B0H21DRAFT_705771 [Amylocystis lapponica]|nr:hypothetical protein B0H21DRAFT_705771 [Amylocystis lapponica]
MTSRLKRKLNDLGVDPSSSKANESFCLIGTPLPPLEKSKDTGEFVPLWKQEVKDEKGRRRLHGAFTGGFSAGYFNTVGSQEGWAPSTFVSSRSERAKQKAARPEDFMDEEDLAELQESRKLVDEHEEMDFGGTEAELRRRGGAVLMRRRRKTSLAPAPKDSVGARILKKMGWRVGQGIGPRLTYAQKKAQDAGLFDSWKESAEGEADEEAKKHTYPRQDTPVVLAPRKDNSHGLGYVPGMRLTESLGEAAREEGSSRGPNIAAGFGLGALNDADDDDLDVYDGGMGRHGRTRMAYDDSLGDDDHQISMGGRKLARGQQSRVTPATTTQTFSDGRPVLRGFALSDRPVAEDRWFPLPDIPKDWKPNPRRVWEQRDNKENVQAEKALAKHPLRTHAEWKDSLMSADERGSLLGETPLPSQPRSVFEFMSQKDRERLENIRNNVPGPSTLPPPPAASAPPPRGVLDIPNCTPPSPRPHCRASSPSLPTPSSSRATPPSSTSTRAHPTQACARPRALPRPDIDEFNKELSDYAKAATVFKPLSGAMAGRFRSAVVIENGPSLSRGCTARTCPLRRRRGGGSKAGGREEEDPRAGAVRLGMYGALTRDVKPWQPARLLCKRFGVKDPKWTRMTEAGAPMEPGVGVLSAGAITDGLSGGRRRTGPRDLANVGLGEDEDQGRDTLTYQRPAMDVFKAIFASDDEDSDEDNDANEVKQEEEDEESVGLLRWPIFKSRPNRCSPASYEPALGPSTPSAVASEKVDIASFKPTFVPRSERDSRKDKPKDKDKDKRKKKSSNKAPLMSFDVEDGLGPGLGAPARVKDRERKKKRRKEHKTEEDDDTMWVEKPPPEVVQVIAAGPTAAAFRPESIPDDTAVKVEEHLAAPSRGRKRAIDFM